MDLSNLHSQCLLCQSTELKTLRGFEAVPLVRCKKCSLVFCEEIPMMQALENYYRNYGKTDFISPITIVRYNEWLDQFEPYRHHNTLLDVGCGNGFFLSQAKLRGWQVYGTEYSPQLVEACQSKGIEMHLGVITSDTFSQVEFDIIVSIEVIEHINNPMQEMQIISNKIRKGGLFFCTTPNFNALSRFLLRAKYNIISYPEHLCYFTPKTLSALMRAHGLRKKKVHTTGISLTRFNQSTGRKKQLVVSATSDDEVLRGRIESCWYWRFVRDVLNGLFVITGTGYSLKGWFVKV